MKIPVIFLTLLLTGCFQSVDNTDIQRAAKICGGFDKVISIEADFTGSEYVKCFDPKKGKGVELDGVSLE